jgi:hypothetical protein
LEKVKLDGLGRMYENIICLHPLILQLDFFHLFEDKKMSAIEMLNFKDKGPTHNVPNSDIFKLKNNLFQSLLP